MSSPAPTPFAPDRSRRLPSPVLLAVDAGGAIVGASAALATFLGADVTAVGKALLDCIEVKLGPSDRPPWDTLRDAALLHPVECELRREDGARERLQLGLQPAVGGGGAFFATLTVPEAPAAAAAPLLVDSGLALLADHGAFGFFDLNFKGGQVYYSPAWKRMLGYTESELANTYDSWLRLLHPEDSAAAPDHVGRRQVRGPRSFAVEVRMLHRLGHYTWVYCLGTQVYGPNGELERVTGLQIDISERKELEEQSLLVEDRFHRLVQAHGLAVFDFNFAGQEFWLSDRWAQLIGTDATSGTAALEAFVEALPPELTLRGAKAFFTEPDVGEPSFARVLTFRQGDSGSLPVLLGAFRQLTRKAELTRVVGFACGLPHSDAEVGSAPVSRAWVEPVLDAVTEALLLVDPHGRILHLNLPAERLLGLDRTAARSLQVDEVFRLVRRTTGEVAEQALAAALDAIEGPALSADHALLPFGSDVPRPIVWSARRLEKAGGNTAGLAIVFRDPDEMSLTPDEMLRINRFETLGLIAGGISHDFNNLLTTILGGISQAKDNKDYSYLADSERACLAAKALTKQLLAVARGSKAEMLQTISPLEVVRDAVRLSRAGSNAEIKIDLPESVAPVRADRGQLLQVLQNLVLNALQALPATGGIVRLGGGNVHLGSQTVGALPEGDYVRIDVRDNGSGIAPENLEKIFEPFFTTKKSGTGLGLAMVRSTVRKYGGDVAVTSTVGTGTTFQVFLPKAALPDQAAPTRTLPSLRFGTGRVLLMDDDPDICRLAEGMLASLDYKSDIARNGEEAITLYRRQFNIGRPYDAVILDLTIVGGAGGEETFQRLRELDKEVRAIVSSGYDSDEMVRHYLELGFSGYLAKPYRAADLGKVLKQVIG